MSAEAREGLRRAVEAVAAQPGEIVTSWALVAEISRPDGGRHLAHRYGGVGEEVPYVWTVVGMLDVAKDAARADLVERLTSDDG